jgi:hypothetical protein
MMFEESFGSHLKKLLSSIYLSSWLLRTRLFLQTLLQSFLTAWHTSHKFDNEKVMKEGTAEQ